MTAWELFKYIIAAGLGCWALVLVPWVALALYIKVTEATFADRFHRAFHKETRKRLAELDREEARR